MRESRTSYGVPLVRTKERRADACERVGPVTDDERLKWKEKEIAKLLRLADEQPAYRKLYTLAAERVQREADAIRRLIARGAKSSGVRSVRDISITQE